MIRVMTRKRYDRLMILEGLLVELANSPHWDGDIPCAIRWYIRNAYNKADSCRVDLRRAAFEELKVEKEANRTDDIRHAINLAEKNDKLMKKNHQLLYENQTLRETIEIKSREPVTKTDIN